jgi:choice-of-anchor B domain-containing protein
MEDRMRHLAILLAISFLSTCGKERKSKKQPTAAEQCNEKGEGWVFDNNECKSLALTSEQAIEECHQRGEQFRWVEGECRELELLSEEQKCQLRGTDFTWVEGACLNKEGAVTFKDPNLESCVKNTFIDSDEEIRADKDGDGVLRADEIAQVTKLNCFDKGIRTLEGLEQLTNLKSLNCSANRINSMPAFSKMPNLEQLICENNEFSDYDCQELAALKKKLKPENLLIAKQSDGRKLTCDQAQLVAHIPPADDKNRFNDVWGFVRGGKQYVVYGEVSHINFIEVFDKAPYFKNLARVDRSLTIGAELWKDPNHTIWSEMRYIEASGKGYVYASTETNWDTMSENFAAFEEKHGKKWCESDQAAELIKELAPFNSQLQIFDVTEIAHDDAARRVKRVSLALNPELASMHNITLEPKQKLLFAFGGADLNIVPPYSEERGYCRFPSKLGTRIYSLEDPAKPKYLGYVGELYVHDGQITAKEVDGQLVTKLYAAHGSTAIHWEANRHNTEANRFRVYDLSKTIQDALASDGVVLPNTQLSNTPLIDQQYANGYCHNIWATEDEQHVVVTGETSVDEQLSFWRLDYENKNAVQTSGVNFQGGAFAHNSFIVGDVIYTSHYTKGAVVLKISEKSGEKVIDPVWSFDTFPEHNGPNFRGSWGIYPFTELYPSLFFATDITTGLYMFKVANGF